MKPLKQAKPSESPETSDLKNSTYQEPERQRITHQQKYLEVLRDTSPFIFEELRPLTPSFVAVFGEPRSNEEIIETYEAIRDFKGLFWDQLKNPVKAFPLTSSTRRINKNFTWKRYKLSLQLTKWAIDAEMGRPDESFWTKPDVELWLSELTQSSRTYMLEQQVRKLVSDMRAAIVGAFGKFGTSEDRLIEQFLLLHTGLFDWMSRNDLERDFLQDCAYLFLGQFAKSPDLRISELMVLGRRYPRQLQADDFEFRSEGWWAGGDETPASYKKRVIAELKLQLDDYLRNSAIDLTLGRRNQNTKPADPHFESLFWMIAWNQGSTYKEIGSRFHRSIDAIKDRLEVLEGYGIPKRIGTQGRKLQSDAKNERLTQIRSDFLSFKDRIIKGG